MCLQCCTDAVTIKENILPGYFLVKASKTYCNDWKEGQLGLVRQNDPDFVWDNPGPDPTAGMTDEEIENLSPGVWGESVKWMKKVEKIEETFRSDPMTSYRFVSACIAAGYDPEKDGYNVVMWFVHLAAKEVV